MHVIDRTLIELLITASRQDESQAQKRNRSVDEFHQDNICNKVTHHICEMFVAKFNPC